MNKEKKPLQMNTENEPDFYKRIKIKKETNQTFINE